MRANSVIWIIVFVGWDKKQKTNFRIFQQTSVRKPLPKKVLGYIFFFVSLFGSGIWIHTLIAHSTREIVVSISTRILKYRVWRIKFDELDFLSGRIKHSFFYVEKFDIKKKSFWCDQVSYHESLGLKSLVLSIEPRSPEEIYGKKLSLSF